MQCLGYNHRIYIESSNIYRNILKQLKLWRGGKLEGQEKMVVIYLPCRHIAVQFVLETNFTCISFPELLLLYAYLLTDIVVIC